MLKVARIFQKWTVNAEKWTVFLIAGDLDSLGRLKSCFMTLNPVEHIHFFKKEGKPPPIYRKKRDGSLMRDPSQSIYIYLYHRRLYFLLSSFIHNSRPNNIAHYI